MKPTHISTADNETLYHLTPTGEWYLLSEKFKPTKIEFEISMVRPLKPDELVMAGAPKGAQRHFTNLRGAEVYFAKADGKWWEWVSDTREWIETEYSEGFIEFCQELGEPEMDMVNHPPHYQSDNGIECIDAIRAALGKDGFIAYCTGNVMKYLWRDKSDRLEDYKKAAWYLNRAIEEQGK